MKSKILFLAVVLISGITIPMHAQDYKIPVENTKAGMLSMTGFSGDITLEGYAGSEIIFTSTNLNKDVPDRAKGLKPVYPGGTDNTGIGLLVEKNGSEVTVTCLLPFTESGGYKVKVPESLAIKMQNGCENASDISVKNMKNEIEIQTCGPIKLGDVSGPLVLSTISGDINIGLAGMNTDKPSSINSISGEIDITMPSKAAVDIEMGTVTGTMYSDLDFNANSKDIKRVGGNQLTSKINGGGTRFSIVTVSGNIYLRKGN
jgi:hypothetical protein